MKAEGKLAARRPIRLTLLTGFLGAGKTTLLNQLLREKEFSETAVIVNEFGDIGIDHVLVEKADDDIIELSSGCVCCTIRGELVEALERLIQAIDEQRVTEVRRIVIETTGLADPAPILHLLSRYPFLGRRISLDGIVTIVDAVHGGNTLNTHEEAIKQIAVADRIVLSKSDIATDDGGELIARLARLNPGCPILDAAKGDAVAAALVDCRSFGLQEKNSDIRRWLAVEAIGGRHDHHYESHRHEDRITTFALTRDAVMEESVLDEFLDRLAFEHAENMIRVKGLIALAPDASAAAVIHGVQGLYSTPVRIENWSDADRHSRLVVIGRDLDRDAVERLFDIYLYQPRPDTPDRQALIDNPLAISGFPGGARAHFKQTKPV